MTRRNRRQFLEESMLAAAAAAASTSGVDTLLAAPTATGRSANDQLGVAVVGVRGRGNSHLSYFATRRDARVLYVCDVDREVGIRRVAQTVKRHGNPAPAFREDFRQILDDPRVDVISIATPNHWHALSAIWAMEAGKDVYVEMPVSHTIHEGRCMVEVARRHQRICQSGLQARSNPGMVAAINFLRDGGIGQVQQARALCFESRNRQSVDHDSPVPDHVNYDLWLGPAPIEPLTRKRLHFDWRWQWPYGSGMLGNQVIHQLDICRWGLQFNTLPEWSLSFAASSSERSSTPEGSCQWNVHLSGDKLIVTEVRELDRRRSPKARVGVIFEGSDGYLVMTSYRSGTAFDPQGRPLRHFRGGGGSMPHFDNFLHAVRTRSCLHVNADIEQGHISSALAHTANISLRLGVDTSGSQIGDELTQLGAEPALVESFEQVQPSLANHMSEPDSGPLRLGIPLACDSGTETFRNNDRANRMRSRSYRRPFVTASLATA